MKDQDVPDFIKKSVNKREFGFDHMGRGPNDRYRVFRSLDLLRKFLRYRTPFAAYSSVAFYEKPQRRDGWIKSELVFDVDAKDIHLRNCNCEGVCDVCLNQAREIVCSLMDILKGDLGLNDIHVIYSGRGYHLRVLDESVMKVNSDVRGQIVKYIIGAEVPQSEYGSDGVLINWNIFLYLLDILMYYREVKYAILHLTESTEMDGVNSKLLKDVIKYREFINNDEWGLFRGKVGLIRYQRLIKSIASLNMGWVDAKVSIDL